MRDKKKTYTHTTTAYVQTDIHSIAKNFMFYLPHAKQKSEEGKNKQKGKVFCKFPYSKHIFLSFSDAKCVSLGAFEAV